MKLEMGEQLEKEDITMSNVIVGIVSDYLAINTHEFETLPTRDPDESLRLFLEEETERLFRKPVALQTVEEVIRQVYFYFYFVLLFCCFISF